MRECVKALTFDFEYSNEPLERHLRITRILEDALRQPADSELQTVDWQKAIELAYKHGQSTIYFGTYPFDMIEHFQGIFLAKAAKFLDKRLCHGE